LKYFFIPLLLWGVVQASGPVIPTWKPGQSLPTVEPDSEPFWRKKQKVYQNMVDQRAIVVSVTERASPMPPRQSLFIQGAGIIDTPVAFAFDQARRFENFPQMSSYIKSVQWQSKSGILFVHMEAFGYGARLRFYVDVKDKKKPPEIRFLVFEGVFLGMSGVIRIEDVERRRAQISMTAQYQFDKLPIPKFFVEFGIEVALRIMATKMRTYIEQRWREHSPNGKEQKSV